jgi:hypothetical protein
VEIMARITCAAPRDAHQFPETAGLHNLSYKLLYIKYSICQLVEYVKLELNARYPSIFVINILCVSSNLLTNDRNERLLVGTLKRENDSHGIYDLYGRLAK